MLVGGDDERAPHADKLVLSVRIRKLAGYLARDDGMVA